VEEALTGSRESHLVAELGHAHKASDGLLTKIDQLADMLQCVLRQEPMTKSEDAPEEVLVERADKVRQIRKTIERGSASISLIINCLEV